MLSLSRKLYYLYRMNKNYTLNAPPNFTQGGVMDCHPLLETAYAVTLTLFLTKQQTLRLRICFEHY